MAAMEEGTWLAEFFEKGRKAKEKRIRLERAQALIRGWLINRWYRKVTLQSKRMEKKYFYLAFGWLAAFKLLLVCLAIEAFIVDPDYKPTKDYTCNDFCYEEETDGVQSTWFQGHKHFLGIGYNILVASHVVSAFGVLFFIPGILLATKGSQAHVWFGRCFVVIWIWHLVDGLSAAAWIVGTRGWNDEAYQDKKGFSVQLFMQFSYLASCVVDFMAHALTVIQYKIATRKPAAVDSKKARDAVLRQTDPEKARVMEEYLEWKATQQNYIPFGLVIANMAFSIITIIFGLGLIIYAIYQFAATDVSFSENPTKAEYLIVFLIQVPPYLVLNSLNISHWVRHYFLKSAIRNIEQAREWSNEHSRNFLFVTNITIVTMLANVGFRFNPRATVYMWASKEIQAYAYAYYRRKVFTKKMAYLKYYRNTTTADRKADPQLVLSTWPGDNENSSGTSSSVSLGLGKARSRFGGSDSQSSSGWSGSGSGSGTGSGSGSGTGSGSGSGTGSGSGSGTGSGSGSGSGTGSGTGSGSSSSSSSSSSS